MDRQGGSESSFRVVDRRRFRADGEAPEAPSPDRAPTPEAPRAAARAGAADSGGEAPADARREAPPGHDAAPLPPPTFSALVTSLALNALAALGLPPGPGDTAAAAPPDVPLARHTIDLLAVLKEKTAGNLTPDEARLLEETLFELRMLFVRAARPAPGGA